MPDNIDQELEALGVTPGWRPPTVPAPGDPASLQNPQTYPLTIGAQPLGVSLGFQALAVAVDNRSGQSVFVQDAGRYVPPQTIGQVIRLAGVSRGVARFETPPNTPAGIEKPVAGQLATLTFYPIPLPETPGIPLAAGAAAVAPSPVIEYVPLTTPPNAPAGYRVPLQTQPISPAGGNSDAVNLVAATAMDIIPMGGLWIVKKIHISSNVGVVNKVRLLEGATGIHTVILPANAQPYIYEWPGEGYRQVLGSTPLRIISDNAGVFGIDADWSPG